MYENPKALFLVFLGFSVQGIVLVKQLLVRRGTFCLKGQGSWMTSELSFSCRASQSATTARSKRTSSYTHANAQSVVVLCMAHTPEDFWLNFRRASGKHSTPARLGKSCAWFLLCASTTEWRHNIESCGELPSCGVNAKPMRDLWYRSGSAKVQFNVWWGALHCAVQAMHSDHWLMGPIVVPLAFHLIHDTDDVVISSLSASGSRSCNL